MPAAKQPSAGNSFQSGLARFQQAHGQLLHPASSAPELPTPWRAPAPPAAQATRLGASALSIPVPGCAAGRGAAGRAQPVLGRVGWPHRAKRIPSEQVCSPKQSRLAPSDPLPWVGPGREGLGRERGSAASWMRPWALRGAAFRLLTWRSLGGGRICVSCSGAGCSAPPWRMLGAQAAVLGSSERFWLLLGLAWPRGSVELSPGTHPSLLNLALLH